MRRWPWILAIVLILSANVLAVGFQVGRCVDYAEGSGRHSYCSSEPALGIPGTWVVGIVSALAVAYCGYRLIHFQRGC